MNLQKIHSDARGSILIIQGTELTDYEEATILYTKKGYARGGCVHRLHDENVCVIEGQIQYIVGDQKFILCAGETTNIVKGIPHYFIALSDTVVLEWGASTTEKLEKHVEYRKIVDEINKHVVLKGML